MIHPNMRAGMLAQWESLGKPEILLSEGITVHDLGKFLALTPDGVLLKHAAHDRDVERVATWLRGQKP